MANREIEVVLDETLAASVDGAVGSGEFKSAQDVVIAALDMWRRDRAEYAEELARFRAEIDEAMNDPGPYLTMDEVRAHLDRRRADEAA